MVEFTPNDAMQAALVQAGENYNRVLNDIITAGADAPAGYDVELFVNESVRLQHTMALMQAQFDKEKPDAA